MELKDILVIGLGALGWLWAVIQFILNRRNQKSDKALEKRFEVYSNFMNTMDEINQNMRSDPNMIYGISANLMSKVLKGDEQEMNQALVDFNTELMEFTKKSVQPMMIINQELNKLKLVCSDKLLPLIEEYKVLANDFVDEFQIVTNKLSSNKDLEITAKELENIGHSARTQRMAELWPQMEQLMRSEIGYYTK